MSPSRLDILASLLPIFHLSIGNLVPFLLASRIIIESTVADSPPRIILRVQPRIVMVNAVKERDVIVYQCGDEFSHCNLRSNQLGLPSTPSLRLGPSGLNRESWGENNESPHSLWQLTWTEYPLEERNAENNSSKCHDNALKGPRTRRFVRSNPRR